MTSDYLEAATRRRVEAELDALGDELEGTFSAETVERYVAESIAGLSDARTKTYLPIFVGRFARDRLRALGQSQGVIVREVPVVPLLCVHISGRSAAARVLLDHYAHGTVEVRSAGWEPGDQLTGSRGRPHRARPRRHEGVSKPLTDEVTRAADVIVTMGCGDTCPVYPGKRYLDWELEDPAGQPVEAVRPIIDDIDRGVQALLAELVRATA